MKTTNVTCYGIRHRSAFQTLILKYIYDIVVRLQFYSRKVNRSWFPDKTYMFNKTFSQTVLNVFIHTLKNSRRYDMICYYFNVYTCITYMQMLLIISPGICSGTCTLNGSQQFWLQGFTRYSQLEISTLY